MKIFPALLTAGLLFLQVAVPAEAQTTQRRNAAIEKLRRAARRANNTSHQSAQNRNGAFSWRPNTTAVKVYGNNGAVQIMQSYVITATETGLTLDIYVGGSEVYSHSFDYRSTSFDGIKAKAKAARLRKVEPEGDMLCGGGCIQLGFYTDNGPYFEVSDESGMRNYQGDFDSVVDLIKGQIPGLYSILESHYDISGFDEDDF